MSSLKSVAALLMVCCAVLFPAAPAHASTHQVMIHNYAYSPASLTIAQGDTVTWTNMDTAQHDVKVTNGPVAFSSPLLAQGKSWSYTFSTAGSYSYICSVHPDMKGSVSVNAVAPATPQVTATAAAPSAPRHTVTTAAAATPKVSTRAQPTRGVTSSAQAAAAVTAPVTTRVAQSEATLSPLLIVLGFSAGVMVFCLLLIVSRPQPVPADDEES
jgi:plastocyanin